MMAGCSYSSSMHHDIGKQPEILRKKCKDAVGYLNCPWDVQHKYQQSSFQVLHSGLRMTELMLEQ